MLTWLIALLVVEPAPPVDPRRDAIVARCMQGALAIRDDCLDHAVRDGDRADRDRCHAALVAADARCHDRLRIERALAWRAPAQWGLSKRRPIQVCRPRGEHDFMADLRCRDGTPVEPVRRAAQGAPEGDARDGIPPQTETWLTERSREADIHIVDAWTVRCGARTTRLYFDMYHCTTPAPWAAPSGFTRPPRAR